MSIKCGRCAGRHESVADVRACYNGQSVTRVAEEVPASQRITDKQVTFLGALLTRARAHLAGDTQLDTITKQYASDLITAMKEQGRSVLPAGVEYDVEHDPFAGIPNADGAEDYRPAAEVVAKSNAMVMPDVPAGHYAVESLTGNNDLDFFRVDRPTEGRWAGRTFVHRVIGGRSNSPVRGKTARAALEAIVAAGIEASGNLYADKLERCRKCNRHLTDQDSRDRRYGPDCAAMLGVA